MQNEIKVPKLEEIKRHILRNREHYVVGTLGVATGLVVLRVLFYQPGGHQWVCDCGWESIVCSTREQATIMGGLHSLHELALSGTE